MKKIVPGLLLLLLLLPAMLVRSEPDRVPPIARFAFLSDPHLQIATNGPEAEMNRHFDDVIAAVNQAKVDFVLIAGDLTQSGGPNQFELFKKQAQRFNAPVLFVPGNHDVGMTAQGETKASINSARVKRFVDHLGPAWFAREQSGVRVIGVNSCLLGSGLPEEQAQWKFLEQELARPASKPTLLLEHYPLFLKTVDEPAGGYWTVPPEPRRRLMQLIRQGHVNAVLTGHLHYPITNRVDGVLFLGTTAVSFGLPKGKQAVGWMLLTLPAQGEMQFEFHEVRS